MAETGMAQTEPRSKPTTEDKLIALQDSLADLHKRMDAWGTPPNAKKDAGEGKVPPEFKEKQFDKKDAAEGEEDAKMDAGAEGDKKDAEIEVPFKKVVPRIPASRGEPHNEDPKSTKKDAEGDEEGKGEEKPKEDTEAEPLAADKAKKDASPADPEGDKLGEIRSDSASLRRRLAELEAMIPKPRTDADLDALAEAQQRWDEVATAHGERASRPLDGEQLLTYDRRHARRYQKHSARWKDIDLSTLPKEVLQIAAPEIRTDAVAAAYRGDFPSGGGLREIRKPDRTGRLISEFIGPISEMLEPFRMPVARVKRINTRPNQY